MFKKIWYAPNKFEAYGEEEIKAVEQCLRDGWLAPGPKTAQLEEQVSAFFGKKYGVMVNSGSSANMIALLCAGVQPGDEIITPALTFSTTVAPIVQLQARPVFIDVEPGCYVPSVSAVLNAVTARTKAIMLPNLAGSKPEWNSLRLGTNLTLIEDSCDTMTTTSSTDISTTSFYASHVITAGGGGGMVMFNSLDEKNKALMYRDWGRIGNNTENITERFTHNIDGIFYDFKFLYGVTGYNFKSTEINAAFGLVQMNKLADFQKKRKYNIARFIQRLQNSSYKLPRQSDKHDWLAMPLMHPKRSEILPFLERNGIQTRVFFAGNITRHPAYRNFLYPYPEADRVMAEGFLLGAHQGMTIEDVDFVCDLLLQWEKDNYK
jgi:CDP-4-dehydro-6-deoxyglucose reductase, E1